MTFRKKIDPKDVEETLSKVKESDLKDKALAKYLCDGKQVTMTCFKTKSEDDLGRSLVIDLAQEWGKGFRQIDHRTVEELIIYGVKYTVKK